MPFTLTSITASNEASGYSSNGPTSSAGASGGESRAGVVDEQVRDAPLGDDLVECARDGRAVRDVDRVRADALGHGASCDVEARDAHPALGEAGEVDLPELAHPAGDDGDAALEIEERVGHAAATVRFALQTASQSSRTQP